MRRACLAVLLAATCSLAVSARGQTILFEEHFDDPAFDGRGWYDGSGGAISSSEHIAGSSGAFECHFAVSATGCSAGTPARHLFSETPTAYLSFWIKHSSNWVGSGQAYHPHQFHFITNQDSQWVGPATSHLTTYIEAVHDDGAGGAHPMLALQDSLNVDPGCILLNNDTWQGCNGDHTTYPFGENRSVCSCNGLVGDVDRRDCFSTGADTWYSSRAWDPDAVYFTNATGPSYKGDWHLVEALFELNSIQGGVGVADGKIRYWLDGELLISSDQVLMRTSANADMLFNQFAMLPYIGDGSPVDQTFWIDELTVATGRPSVVPVDAGVADRGTAADATQSDRWQQDAAQTDRWQQDTATGTDHATSADAVTGTDRNGSAAPGTVSDGCACRAGSAPGAAWLAVCALGCWRRWRRVGRVS